MYRLNVGYEVIGVDGGIKQYQGYVSVYHGRMYLYSERCKAVRVEEMDARADAEMLRDDMMAGYQMQIDMGRAYRPAV